MNNKKIGIDVVDRRFKFLDTFALRVPGTYNHSIQLASFKKLDRGHFRYYNAELTDLNYSKVSRILLPRERYVVDIFRMMTRVRSEECLKFLEKNRAILIGAQGISLAWQESGNMFLFSGRKVSFDQAHALWVDPIGHHRVPFIDCCLGGGWRFSLGRFEDVWSEGDCLLCFRKRENKF